MSVEQDVERIREILEQQETRRTSGERERSMEAAIEADRKAGPNAAVCWPPESRRG